ADLMNETLVPEIMRIIDLQKEMRAQGLVTEAEKNSFVVQKAKETGITSQDLETVMNAAYIYLPIISQVSIEKDKRNNSASATVRGGILWFKINSAGDNTSVDLLVKKEATGSNIARLDGEFNYGGRRLDGAEYAFVSAAKTFARNLKVATQEIPEFQLTNPLTTAGAGWVELPMGKSEGLGLDDKFIIAEYYEQADKSLIQKKLGMVRVSKVSHNPKEGSRARNVIGGGFQRGMVALEPPRLPIDLSFRFGMAPLAMNTKESGNDETFNGTIYTGQLWFNYNLAKSTQWSQFFVSLYGEFGGGSISDLEIWYEEVPAGMYAGIGIGFAKKLYFNRFHLGLEALGSYAHYNFSDTPSGYDSYEWSLSTIGLTFNGNLEIALGYDVLLGGGVSYKLFAPSTNWTYKENGEKVDVTDENDIGELDFSGVGFQLYLTWSLPSLSYDPLAAARGMIGH
ncbi:hypothetical protein KKA00_08880, partial [bacterium]|nr:hypothetical protein [bacterium]